MSAMTFEYQALDKAGQRIKGSARAADQMEAFRQLAASGLTPIKVKAVRERGAGAKVKLRDLAQFTYQFSVLISARISISEGLTSIAEQESNLRLAMVIRDVATRIQSGEQVAVAMNAHRDVFGDVFVDTIRAAERTGTLGRSLEHLSEMLERRAETAQQVKGALMYPMVVLGVLFIAVAFLIAFVIPKFGKMFKERGVELPIFTQALMWIGDSVQSYWWVYILAGAGAFFFARKALSTRSGRLRLDAMMHRVPYLKQILVGMAIARFSRVFGMSLSAGLGLIESLELAGRASGRPTLEQDTARMADQVRRGGRLRAALAECSYFTSFTKRMIAAGEESAELHRMCGVVAKHYERETGHLTKNIATVIEPLMIVLVAGIVLVIALAIFLPMWNMVSLVG